MKFRQRHGQRNVLLGYGITNSSFKQSNKPRTAKKRYKDETSKAIKEPGALERSFAVDQFMKNAPNFKTVTDFTTYSRSRSDAYKKRPNAREVVNDMLPPSYNPPPFNPDYPPYDRPSRSDYAAMDDNPYYSERPDRWGDYTLMTDNPYNRDDLRPPPSNPDYPSDDLRPPPSNPDYPSDSVPSLISNSSLPLSATPSSGVFTGDQGANPYGVMSPGDPTPFNFSTIQHLSSLPTPTSSERRRAQRSMDSLPSLSGISPILARASGYASGRLSNRSNAMTENDYSNFDPSLSLIIGNVNSLQQSLRKTSQRSRSTARNSTELNNFFEGAFEDESKSEDFQGESKSQDETMTPSNYSTYSSYMGENEAKRNEVVPYSWPSYVRPDVPAEQRRENRTKKLSSRRNIREPVYVQLREERSRLIFNRIQRPSEISTNQHNEAMKKNYYRLRNYQSNDTIFRNDARVLKNALKTLERKDKRKRTDSN